MENKETFHQNEYESLNNSADVKANKSVKKVKTCIEKADKILKKYDDSLPLNEMKYEDISDTLSEVEKANYRLRFALDNAKTEGKILVVSDEKKSAEIEDEKRYLNMSFEEEKLEQIRCNFDGKVFTINTPLTFQRGYKSKNISVNYEITNLILTAITKWENDNQIVLLGAIKPPFYMVMKRKDSSFNIQKTYDNDNLENQRIINTICRKFHLPDNAKNMTLISMFEETEDEKKRGMEFKIFSQNELENNINLIKFQTDSAV